MLKNSVTIVKKYYQLLTIVNTIVNICFTIANTNTTNRKKQHDVDIIYVCIMNVKKHLEKYELIPNNNLIPKRNAALTS